MARAGIRLVAAAMVAILATLGTAEAAGPKRAQLTAQDRADIARAETWLNGFTTMKAHFLQIAGNGGQAEGTAFLSRPGRLRLQYDPPSPMLVVADGSFLIVYDRQLGDPSYIPLDSTPAGVLVREKVNLDGPDLMVTHVARHPGALVISLAQTEDNAAGELVLVFSDQPFALRQWRVIDPQGQITTVSLYDTQLGTPLDPKLFQFKDPKFAKQKFNDG